MTLDDKKRNYYDSLIEQVPNVGNIYPIMGTIPKTDEEYFNDNGCATVEYNFGNVVCTEIVRINSIEDGKIKPSSNTKAILIMKI
jgi:hypothetical protein